MSNPQPLAAFDYVLMTVGAVDVLVFVVCCLIG